MSNELMLTRIVRKSKTTIVRPCGGIDIDSSPAFRTDLLAIAERRPSRVVIDLSAVTHIDLSGVGTLVEFKRRIERTPGAKLVLAGILPRDRGLFEVSKLDQFFTIVHCADDTKY